MATDIRRCGKCHHFQPHEVEVTDTERKLTCMICGEVLIEEIEEGYGLPYPTEEEVKKEGKDAKK